MPMRLQGNPLCDPCGRIRHDHHWARLLCVLTNGWYGRHLTR